MPAIKGRVSAVTAGAGDSEAKLVDNIKLQRKREDSPAVGESARK